MGPLPHRVREHVQVCVWQLFDESPGLGVVGVGLSREARDDVGSESQGLDTLRDLEG